MSKAKTKKTVVKIKDNKNHNKALKSKIVNENEIDNDSYTENLLKDELTKDLVLTEIDKCLTDLIKAKKEIEKDKIKDKIRELLSIYNEKNVKNAFAILNIDSVNDIYSQDKSLRQTRDYKAFVYYFWNPRNMNFRIIGLHEVNPLFEIIDTKELYFLDKPTMSTLGKPVYFIVKGTPFSREIQYDLDNEKEIEEFIMKGYNPAVLRALVDSAQFIKIFGKQRIPFRLIMLIISSHVILGLILHIIYTGYFAL